MRRVRAINLIAFCMFALFVDNNRLTEGHSLREYLRILPALKNIKSLRHGILPGTLWCGPGNIARDDSELGVYRELDMCCRAHDRCEDYIKSKTTRYGLYNKSICRSSLCECEVRFYDCLRQVHRFYSSSVGKIYFGQCRKCFRTYNDPKKCINEGLDINESMDRKGRPVFCAKFDRNPKWGQRHNTTQPKSISTPELSTWDDDEVALRSYFANDKNSDDEDDVIYKSYVPMEDNY